MKRTTWCGAALLGLALLAGCGEKKKDLPSDTDASKKDGDAPKEGTPKDVVKKDDKDKKKIDKPSHVVPPPLKPTGDVVKLTSVAYGEENQKDPDVTTLKYAKKFLEVTGKVTKVGRAPDGKGLVELQGAKDALLGVQCFTRDTKPWLAVLPGQTVKVQGIGPQVAGAGLDQCDVLSVSGDRPAVVQADALAKEFGSGVAATKKKYEGKHLIVEGDVASVKAEEDEPVIVVLKTKPGPSAYLRFATDSPEGKRAAALKPGQPVKAVGLFSVDGLSGKSSVGVSEAMLLDQVP